MRLAPRPHWGRQGVRAAWAQRKPTAGGTAVGPLPCVPNPVLYQLPLHVEGLAALITGEDFIGRVRLLVLLQVTEVTEPWGDQNRCSAEGLRTLQLAVFRTKKRKTHSSTSPTDVTQVWLLSRVDNDVTLDITRCCKPVM